MYDENRGIALTGLRRVVAVGAALMLCSAAGAQQSGGLAKEALEAKLAAVKQAAAANKAALRQYIWTETMQVALNGEVKSTKVMSCRYGTDGQVIRTPVSAPPEQKGGPLRRRMVEKKTEELTDYMEQVKGVIGLYVPPDSARMQAAFQAGNLSLGRPAAGEAGLDFKNYAKPGDAMNLDFSMAAKKLASLSVNSYTNDPSQAVALSVQFAGLPDGTSYPANIVVNAPAKSIQVTITNSNYLKLAAQ